MLCYSLALSLCCILTANGVTIRRGGKEQEPLVITSDTARFRFHRNNTLGEFYVDDAGPASIFAYPLSPDGTLGHRRLLAHSDADGGVPDGLHCDDRGFLWAGHGDGVHVYDPDSGSRIGKFLLPGGRGVANFCWAGPDPHVPGTFTVLVFAEDELWQIGGLAVNGYD